MTEDVQHLYDRIREFEWDESKADANRRKHGIDFDDAVEVFYGPVFLVRSDRNEEERWLAYGESDGHVLALVFTWREDVVRIISARRARKDERRAYHQAKMGRAAEEAD